MTTPPGSPIVIDDPREPPLPEPSEPSEPERSAEPAKKDKVDWVAEIRGLALMLLGVLAFHTFVAKPFYIPSTSMMPTLLVGDRLVVSKYPYGWSWVSASLPFHILPRADWRIAPATPAYGDIVIPVPPHKTEDYIKRVVGLPGDRIAMVDGQIILNGKPVRQEVEPAVRIEVDPELPLYEFESYRARLPDGREVYEPPTYRETLPNGASYLIIDHLQQQLDNFREIEIPEGHVFLMGDNRDHSADSRADAWSPANQSANGLGGPVPIADIGGRAEFITFSLDGSAGWNPLSWLGALRTDRAWTSLRPELRGSDQANGRD